MSGGAPPVTELRALVLLNGACPPQSRLLPLPESTVIIAVDGGLNHCVALDLLPQVLIGDFDSADAALVESFTRNSTTKPEVVTFATEKDATDMQLAFEYLLERDFAHVTLAGVSGGRTDQMLGNWLLLGQSRWVFTIDVVDSTGSGFVLSGGTTRRIPINPGTTVSLLALTETAVGVTTEGLHYALHNADIGLGNSLGISNVANDAEIAVTLREGSLLVFVNNQELA